MSHILQLPYAQSIQAKKKTGVQVKKCHLIILSILTLLTTFTAHIYGPMGIPVNSLCLLRGYHVTTRFFNYELQYESQEGP